jgi:hypothetical protein
MMRHISKVDQNHLNTKTSRNLQIKFQIWHALTKFLSLYTQIVSFVLCNPKFVSLSQVQIQEMTATFSNKFLLYDVLLTPLFHLTSFRIHGATYFVTMGKMMNFTTITRSDLVGYNWARSYWRNPVITSLNVLQFYPKIKR